jgi:hypothetical protein
MPPSKPEPPDKFSGMRGRMESAAAVFRQGSSSRGRRLDREKEWLETDFLGLKTI